MAAEVGEMFPDQRYFRQPALDIDAKQFVHMGAFDVQPRRVEIGHLGNPSDRCVVRMHLTVAALEDPLQRPAVLTVTRP